MFQGFRVPSCCRGAIQWPIYRGSVSKGEERWEDWDVVREVFLIKCKRRRSCEGLCRTCTSLTTSYSSTSASRSIADLVNMLLKSEWGWFSISVWETVRQRTDRDSILRTLVPLTRLPTLLGCLRSAGESRRTSYAPFDRVSCCPVGQSGKLGAIAESTEWMQRIQSVSMKYGRS